MATVGAALIARCRYHLRCGWASLPQPQPGGSAPYGCKIGKAYYLMTGVAVLRIIFCCKAAELVGIF
uniref:Uncharacterized protein n=1 Tax=Aegilops tauschii TaxID=37682 RepID=M8BWP3_AEGTA